MVEGKVMEEEVEAGVEEEVDQAGMEDIDFNMSCTTRLATLCGRVIIDLTRISQPE